MTFRVIATKGDKREVVGRALPGGGVMETFHDRESAELHAAVWAACNLGWEFEVEPWESK